MSTFISFYVKSRKREELLNILKRFSSYKIATQSEFPTEIQDILSSEESHATCLVIVESGSEWTTVYSNSFKRLRNWGEIISQELDTTFIQTMGQTTSDVYYFLMYEKGKLIREIEVFSGEGEVQIDKGEKFSFEKAPLLSDDSDDSDNFFDMDTLQHYCSQFGLDISKMFEEPQGDYIVLKRMIDNSKSESATDKKHWWKIW